MVGAVVARGRGGGARVEETGEGDAAAARATKGAESFMAVRGRGRPRMPTRPPGSSAISAGCASAASSSLSSPSPPATTPKPAASPAPSATAAPTATPAATATAPPTAPRSPLRRRCRRGPCPRVEQAHPAGRPAGQQMMAIAYTLAMVTPRGNDPLTVDTSSSPTPPTSSRARCAGSTRARRRLPAEASKGNRGIRGRHGPRLSGPPPVAARPARGHHAQGGVRGGRAGGRVPRRQVGVPPVDARPEGRALPRGAAAVRVRGQSPSA